MGGATDSDMKELWQHITQAADISLSDVTVQNGWGWGGGAWEGKEGSHGMLLDAWDELLGIRIQPAVDLGEKKKTLVSLSGQQEVSNVS